MAKCLPNSKRNLNAFHQDITVSIKTVDQQLGLPAHFPLLIVRISALIYGIANDGYQTRTDIAANAHVAGTVVICSIAICSIISIKVILEVSRLYWNSHLLLMTTFWYYGMFSQRPFPGSHPSV
jgi:hypothetical protein